MDVTGSVALVSGANRGIGRRLVAELQERGAAKIYATARDPRSITVPGVEVLQLDITDAHSVAATCVDLCSPQPPAAHSGGGRPPAPRTRCD